MVTDRRAAVRIAGVSGSLTSTLVWIGFALLIGIVFGLTGGGGPD